MVAALAVAFGAQAQENQIRIVEDFENGAQLEWAEMHSKKGKDAAHSHNGYFVLRGFGRYTFTNIKMINPNMDFHVKVSLTTPKMDKKNWFGLLYNPIRTEKGTTAFKSLLFRAGQSAFCPELPLWSLKVKGTECFYMFPDVDKRKIQNQQIPAGSNVAVNLEMVRRGSEVFFYINEVEAAVVEAENFGMFGPAREMLTLGFVTSGLELRVEEITITQDVGSQQ